jgi:hypothetical protein
MGTQFSRWLKIVFWAILPVCIISCTYEKLYIVYDEGIYLDRVEPDDSNSELLLPGIRAISPDASTDGQFFTFLSNSASDRLVGLWNGSSKVGWYKQSEFEPYIFNPSPINASGYLFSELNTRYLDIYSSAQAKNITNFRSMDFELWYPQTVTR